VTDKELVYENIHIAFTLVVLPHNRVCFWLWAERYPGAAVFVITMLQSLMLKGGTLRDKLLCHRFGWYHSTNHNRSQHFYAGHINKRLLTAGEDYFLVPDYSMHMFIYIDPPTFGPMMILQMEFILRPGYGQFHKWSNCAPRNKLKKSREILGRGNDITGC